MFALSKKILSFLKRRILQYEDHTRILIDFASVWPRLFLRGYDNFGSEKLSILILNPKSPIFRPLVAIQKSFE